MRFDITNLTLYSAYSYEIVGATITMVPRKCKCEYSKYNLLDLLTFQRQRPQGLLKLFFAVQYEVKPLELYFTRSVYSET